MRRKRIGIFGGSFDPVHLGHLWIAETAMERLQLDALHWIPVAQSPLKARNPLASDQQRLEMLALAVSGRDGWVVDDREIRREGVSYTVDTVEQLQAEMPDTDWYLIIGSDSLASMERWHEPEKLLRQVTLAVVQRGGQPEIEFSVLDGLVDAARVEEFRQSVIKMPVIEISSSEIRERVGQGSSIRFRVPRPVETYIEANDLYPPLP
ncbi:nicotinate (nicotinamide) nucleotide adenylyltransferase [Stieleria varia]|uniref:Probable nicotinate-nucleotide adenylyltransferase n=1 Tax=Stieleria varia TaxID=2528005 RepID=A0A5C6APF4_9BACT|nr:nicotinate (nicotinamide) nucleotide adenylyltransferase [Stieleria varia]TWU00902.1 Nicotinate-nucleotide adenylyltransferase [Stieleria varia]